MCLRAGEGEDEGPWVREEESLAMTLDEASLGVPVGLVGVLGDGGGGSIGPGRRSIPQSTKDAPGDWILSKNSIVGLLWAGEGGPALAEVLEEGAFWVDRHAPT